MTKDLIFMEHDGAVDDLLSQLLLMTMDDKEIIGINVTPADCFLEPATESTYKSCNYLTGKTLKSEEVIITVSMLSRVNGGPDPK
jgi:purine nucleosidase